MSNAGLFAELRRVGERALSQNLQDLLNRAADALAQSERDLADELSSQGLPALIAEIARLRKVIAEARRLNDSQSNSADQWKDMNRVLSTSRARVPLTGGPDPTSKEVTP